MHIVITHSNADCDAFASQIAVQRLYPGARVVLSRRVAPRVHRFLALHADAFDLYGGDEINAADVQELTVVDVRPRRRLREHRALLERIDEARASGKDAPYVRVFDHHEPDADDLAADEACVERVGATTTMLVERIAERGLELPVEEATLYALAIHVDTGSLTYDTTTGRDARAIEWLIGAGANIDVVEHFLRLPLSPDQRRAFMLLMGSMEEVELDGVRVAIGGVYLDSNVDGLAQVTTHALRLSGYSALFAAFDLRGRKVQIVGRSRTEALHVGQVLKSLGGGGHSSAGAALLKTSDPHEAISRLRTALATQDVRSRSAAELCTQLVPEVDAALSIEAAHDALVRDGARAAFVRRDGELVGSFDLAFARRALAAGRGALPVKSSMAHDVGRVDGATRLGGLAEVMEAATVGIVLVEDGAGAVLGALTRADLMRAFYEDGW